MQNGNVRGNAASPADCDPVRVSEIMQPLRQTGRVYVVRVSLLPYSHLDHLWIFVALPDSSSITCMGELHHRLLRLPLCSS